MSVQTDLRRPASERTGSAWPAPLPPARGRGMDPTRGQHAPPGTSERATVIAAAALLLTACLPLTRVFVGREFLLPVMAAVLLALTVDWGCRRAEFGPGTTLVASILACLAFVGIAFLDNTLLLGLLPTPATLAALQDLWLRGLELVQLRPSPAIAEAGLLLLAVLGVWAVAHAVDALVFRLRAPLMAIAMAMVLWAVPLVIVPSTGAFWRLTVPFLAAATALLLASAGGELGRFGQWHHPGGRGRNPLAGVGTGLAVLAIVLGTTLASSLPGFADGPWYALRGLGASTLTQNPIVGIQQRLVASDTGPIFEVTSPRPVYVRTTSLDVYGDNEEWTNAGIDGTPVVGRGDVPQGPIAEAERIAVSLEVQNLDGAVLVPTPYQTDKVHATVDGGLTYDARLATFTTREGQTLQPGDRVLAEAVIPTPEAGQLNTVGDAAPGAPNTELPEGVPDAVRELAEAIVAQPGVETRFQKALAIQNELRSWTYSLDAPPGHGATAMERFLATRTGYCEQYAGTMAVMLRELGIPARVAVGFTPGTPISAGGAAALGPAQRWSVSYGNAHAWVEVDFEEYGWVAFEPTPRSDGNVLVPSAVNLAPREILAAPLPDVGDRLPAAAEDANDVLVPGLGDLDVENPEPAPGFPAPGGDGGASRLGGLAAVALTVAGLAAGGLAFVGLRSSRAVDDSPRERVLAARRRVGRLGAGLGAPAAPWETDSEYLRRLVGVATRRRGWNGGRGDGPLPAESVAALADAVARARWARALSEQTAARAETAAVELSDALLGGLTKVERAAVRVRAPLTAGVADLRRRWRAPQRSLGWPSSRPWRSSR